jgi:hypothetical protein
VATALADAAAASRSGIVVNSALRTLPQQFLLRSWDLANRCGIRKAANVGESNHEQGLAVDIENHGALEPAMRKSGFKWFGSSDPVHFDYVASSGGGGAGSERNAAADLTGLSVTAFQRLWNRNHPDDPVEVTGSYDATMKAKLELAPAAGFPIGPACGGGAGGAGATGAAAADQPPTAKGPPEGSSNGAATP